MQTSICRNKWIGLDSDSDFAKYSEDLKNEFKLIHVQKAFWIQTKNITATPLILTFREKEPPKFLNIIGEQSKTKVFEYFERPMMCQDCLDYGHTTKRCQKSTPICAKCNTKGHSKKIVEKMKSYAITVKTTTTAFQEIAQDTNLKLKSSKSKRENAYQKPKQRGDY